MQPVNDLTSALPHFASKPRICVGEVPWISSKAVVQRRVDEFLRVCVCVLTVVSSVHVLVYVVRTASLVIITSLVPLAIIASSIPLTSRATEHRCIASHDHSIPMLTSASGCHACGADQAMTASCAPVSKTGCLPSVAHLSHMPPIDSTTASHEVLVAQCWKRVR